MDATERLCYGNCFRVESSLTRFARLFSKKGNNFWLVCTYFFRKADLIDLLPYLCFSALFKVKSFLTCDVLLQKFDGVARIIFTTSFSQPLLHVLHSPLVDRLGPLSFNRLAILGSWATVTWFRTRFACFTVRISWMQWWQWRFHRHPEVSSLGSSWAKLLSFVVTHFDFTNFLTKTKILYFNFFCISFKQHCGNSSDNIDMERGRKAPWRLRTRAEERSGAILPRPFITFRN